LITRQLTRRPILALGVIGLAFIVFLVPTPGAFVERFYSGLAYPPLQRAITSMSNLAPFALFDVLIVGFPLLWILLVARDVVRSPRRARALARWLVRTAAAVAMLYLLFLLTWGLNYRRVPLERKIPYDSSRVTVEAAREATQFATDRLNALYPAAHAIDTIEPVISSSLATAFAGATRELGASGATVPARPKTSILNLYFRPAAVAGMTDPYFLETLVESDLLPIERPFVIAHEWSHLAGFADEGEANFAGWLACTRADALSQYSGWLFLFGELVNSIARNERAGAVARLDSGPRDDLRAIAARLAREVRPRVSAAGWRVYDRYLKANRVEAGAASYAQVVRLVLGTELGLSASKPASPAR